MKKLIIYMNQIQIIKYIVENVVKTIKEGKKRDAYDIDLAFYRLNQKENGIDIKNKICEQIHENISIPEVLNSFCESGKIILKCDNCINPKIKEINVEDYFKIFENKKINNLDSFDAFKPIKNSQEELSNYKNVIKEKIEELLYIIKFYSVILREQDKFPYCYNQSLINLENFIKEENNISIEFEIIIENLIKYKN